MTINFTDQDDIAGRFADLPRAFGAASASTKIRQKNEDFFVSENIGFQPKGKGEHQLVLVRKSGLNTADLANKLARLAGIRAADVGFSGRKDKYAVTEQWFSLHLPGKPNVELNDEPGWSVLRNERHDKKIRSGSHKSNRFEIVLRDCCGEKSVWERKLESVREQGFPNYFGEQRFGRGFSNLHKAELLFQRRLKKAGRQQKSMFLSAARSWLFNEVCSRRVADGSWVSPIEQDRLILEGSGSYFCTENPTEDQERVASGDVHVSGPLWGRFQENAEDALFAREMSWLEPYNSFRHGLESAGMKMQRRPLRSLAHELQWRWLDNQTLSLSFVLNKGVFATALLRELGNCTTGE